MGDAKGRRMFDREFKESSVRLIVDGGRSVAESSRLISPRFQGLSLHAGGLSL